MRSFEEEPWQAGERVLVRGRVWRIVERTHFPDCDALRLAAAGPGDAGARLTVLTPFDRPRRVQRASSIQVVRPRRWLHALRREAANAHPAGGLKRTAASAIDLLAYQLEPALAMVGLGVPRLMIADAVGLGKTIQAGIILTELASEPESFRALIVAPAGLRSQWSQELADRFGLSTTVAGAAWLARIGRELPADVNPWILPGIYVTSFDFIKQPEVLHSLEDAHWNVLVIDEAHGAALATARRAAVHAIALRSSRVLLLTATPHAGDANQFAALCRIGETAAAGDELMIFVRSRSDAGVATARRTALLPVRLSDAERRMHRLLDRYTDRVCREARARGDTRARLAAIILKKRALSSAESLAVSARKRLALLATTPPPAECQLGLPLGDEDRLEDEEPFAALAAPGLADAGREQRWLAAIVEAAQNGARRESKARFLLRLLSRMRQPAIVFTEYRDTLERLQAVLTAAGHDVAILHGGLSPAERSAVQRAFNESGSGSAGGTEILLATDAASEGLNLHGRCRAVVHYELPWSPARLDQRTGRVDRIGQARTVHEILLVADDTAERLVLAPLARRAARARAAVPAASRLLDVLTESRVTNAVMDGVPAMPLDSDASVEAGVTPAVNPPIWLRQRAEDEARRLLINRKMQFEGSKVRGSHDEEGPIAATAVRLRNSSLAPGLICVYALRLCTARGDIVHTELAVVHEPIVRMAHAPAPAAVRRLIREFVAAREPALRAALLAARQPGLEDFAKAYGFAADVLNRRERVLTLAAPSAARELVQGGLFDRRAERAQTARRRAASMLIDRLDAPAPGGRLTTAVQLSAVLVAIGSTR
jgi:superfamily II DNA or RNA helicase